METEEKGETVIYLMTEAVSPLEDVLRDNDMRGPERWVFLRNKGQEQERTRRSLASSPVACMAQCRASVEICEEPAGGVAEPACEVLLGCREQYIAMGLHHVVNAISFLNNDCKLVHGNVCMASVVVTEQLDWKLHGFDLLSEHQWGGGPELPLMCASWMVGSQYKPGEVAKSEWQVGSRRWRQALEAGARVGAGAGAWRLGLE